jgi:hypothetical protein
VKVQGFCVHVYNKNIIRITHENIYNINNTKNKKVEINCRHKKKLPKNKLTAKNRQKKNESFIYARGTQSKQLHTM